MKYVLHLFATTGSNPADSTTLYFSHQTVPTLGYDAMKIAIPIAGTIQRIDAKVDVGGLASAEPVNFFLRVNDTTDVGPVTFDFTASHSSGSATVSQIVAAGDFIAAKIVTPSWVTNPTAVKYWMTIVIENT